MDNQEPREKSQAPLDQQQTDANTYRKISLKQQITVTNRAAQRRKMAIYLFVFLGATLAGFLSGFGSLIAINLMLKAGFIIPMISAKIVSSIGFGLLCSSTTFAFLKSFSHKFKSLKEVSFETAWAQYEQYSQELNAFEEKNFSEKDKVDFMHSLYRAMVLGTQTNEDNVPNLLERTQFVLHAVKTVAPLKGELREKAQKDFIAQTEKMFPAKPSKLKVTYC
ncbi:MAG: hypothetical protein JSS07_06840 [Proteobacteria bacterium]|nr:hypothetical protein [Pseudomonadota bacterium]